LNVDLLFRAATLIDGSGAPRRRADVAVSQGRIAAITEAGACVPGSACECVHAEGLVLAPGFIDSHSHDDRLLLQAPRQHPKLLQGVTTVITGNCGISLAPMVGARPPAPLDLLSPDGFGFAEFADYVAALERQPPATNAALLVGHSNLRLAAMGEAALQREANAAECAAMREGLARALDAGAIGLSTGLFYAPAQAASAAEVIAVAQALRDGAGIVTMHLRDEGAAIDAAMEEAIAIGRALNAPLVLSHHKLIGPAQHGRSAHTLARVAAWDAAAQAGQGPAVCIDCYPYTASSTTLLPQRVAMSREVQITWSQAQPEAAGQLLSTLAAAAGLAPQEMAQRLLPAGAIYFAMSDEDVERILAHPLCMVGSDGLAGEGSPHPRLWGSFPRVLGHYARDRGLFSLETAVHKMTGLPARRFGLSGRGLVREGFAADLTLFDAATVADAATYATPTAAPRGIHGVWIHGRQVVHRGEVLALNAGRVLRRRSATLEAGTA
jgi:N-acyl-D-amino-acid deacylase